MDNNQTYETLVFRVNSYNALKDFYNHGPSQQVFKQLQGLLDMIDEIDHPMFIEGIKDIKQFLDSEYNMEELQVEYTNLFIGPATIKVMPYESGYENVAKPMLFTEAALEARKTYLEHGLMMEKFLSKPEDHISTEFEFMVYLIEKILDELKKGNDIEAIALHEKQKEFFMKHLNNWVDKFANLLLKESSNKLFQGIAKLTLGLISFEREIFEIE